MIERSIEEEERQQKSTHTIHFYIVLLSYWTRVQSLESKWQKYKFFMCCRPATCHYPGFNPSADCMEFTQTFHWIPKHYHQYKVTYRTLERDFPYFDWHFAGGSQCVPRKSDFLHLQVCLNLHFSEPRPFCITKPNNDFFYVGQTSLMRSRLVSGPAIHIAALSRRAYSVERFFICTCLFMSCYWSKPHVDNWSSNYVHSILVWL